MAYVIEGKHTSADGTVERWLVTDPRISDAPRVFATIGAARELASKYRAWSKSWAGKRSFRVLEAGAK